MSETRQDPTQQKITELEKIVVNPPKSLSLKSDDVDSALVEPETDRVIKRSEAISKIVAPYFIVVVGAAFYKENFVVGLFLMTLGVFGLFRLSGKDITAFWESIKSFLGLT